MSTPIEPTTGPRGTKKTPARAADVATLTKSLGQAYQALDDARSLNDIARFRSAFAKTQNIEARLKAATAAEGARAQRPALINSAKDPRAVALGKRRVALMSSADRAAMSSAGGVARAAKLTPRRLSEIGRKGAAARWGVSRKGR